MPRLPPDKSWRTSTLWRSCTVGSLRPLLPGIHSTSFTKSTCSGSRRRACLLDPSAEEPMLSPPHRGRRGGHGQSRCPRRTACSDDTYRQTRLPSWARRRVVRDRDRGACGVEPPKRLLPVVVDHISIVVSPQTEIGTVGVFVREEPARSGLKLQQVSGPVPKV